VSGRKSAVWRATRRMLPGTTRQAEDVGCWGNMRSRTLNIGFRVANLLSKSLLLLILAHYLPPSEFGRFGVFLVTVVFGVMVVGLDFYAFSTREVHYLPLASWGSILKTQIVLSLGMYVLVVLVGSLLVGLAELPAELAVWLAVLVFFEHLGQELVRLLTTSLQQVWASLILLLRGGAWVGPLWLAMAIWPSFRNIHAVLAFWATSAVIASAVGLARLLGMGIGGWRRRFDWRLMRRGLVVAVPLLIGTLALRSVFTIDRYVVAFTADETALGAYVLFVAIGGAIFTVVDAAVLSFSYPSLIRAVAGRDHPAFSSDMRKMTVQTIVCVATLVAISGIVLVPMLSWVASGVYLEFASLYPWIIAAFSLYALSMIPHFGLYALGLDREIVRNHLLALVGFVVAVSVLSWRWSTLVSVPAALCAAGTVLLIGKARAYRSAMSRRTGTPREVFD
jgi:O-antigen/teichoic acid export membrane protein